MRVLIVQRFDLSSVSCARRVISQAGELANLGHEVTLVDMPHPDRQARVGKTKAALDVPILELERSPTAFFRNLRALDRQPRADVVHLWKSYPDAAIPALGHAWMRGIPVHYDWDDWEEGITQGLTGSRTSAALVLRWERALCNWADSVSVASQALREAATEFGCPESKLVDLPVGVDTDRFYPREPDESLRAELGLSSPVLVYLGQLEVESYADHAVGVLREFRKTFSEATLLVVGGGRLSPILERAADTAGLRDAVRLTGYIDADEVPNYLALGDVALAPFEDNQVTRCKSPLKIAEYLAMGMKVVASDVGEARTMLREGELGRLVPPGDAAAMGRMAVELFVAESSSLLDTYRPFTWRRHAEILAETYERVL